MRKVKGIEFDTFKPAMNKNDYIKIKPKGFKKGESIWIDKLTGTKKHVVVPVGKKPSDLAMEINYVYTKK